MKEKKKKVWNGESWNTLYIHTSIAMKFLAHWENTLPAYSTSHTSASRLWTVCNQFMFLGDRSLLYLVLL